MKRTFFHLETSKHAILCLRGLSMTLSLEALLLTFQIPRFWFLGLIHKTVKAMNILKEFAPMWLQKLPFHIQSFILVFVAIHFLAIFVIAYVHLTSKKGPDFKAKIK